jgi:hypothetical protein
LSITTPCLVNVRDIQQITRCAIEFSGGHFSSFL